MKVVLALILFLLSLLMSLYGCSSDTNDAIRQEAGIPESVQKQDVTSEASKEVIGRDNVIAVSAQSEIRLNELDKRIALALFDLEWRKYELRRETLNQMLEEQKQLDPSPFSVSLVPPEAPRIDLPKDKREVIGSVTAPISLAVFCSYQSTHCGRLNTTLTQLRSIYGEHLQIKFYDYPQRFHRYGYNAANAVQCAASQGAMERFQSALFMDQSSLANERFFLIAEQLKLDSVAFKACVESGQFEANIDADVALGQRLGLGNVPIVFINGLYTKGPRSVDAFSYYIDQEMNRLGLSKSVEVEEVAVLSDLPLYLVATTVSSDPQQSIAQVAMAESGTVMAYSEGDYLQDDVILAQIEERKILILNGERLEFIPLSNRQNEAFEDEVEEAIAETQEATPYREIVPGAPVREQNDRPYRELPSTGEMPLDRDWIANQLANQEQLAEKFHLADHVVEGVHLIKLHNIKDDRFYNTLGLQEGDVLMRINDQWVHEKQNPLWSALENDETITIFLMRKGFPVRYDYRVQ